MRASRSRVLGWFFALGMALLASVQGCDCGSTGLDTRRFACTQDDECASGFVCREGECQPEGSTVEDGGVDGGTPDGGGDGGPTDGTDGGTLPDGGTPARPTQITFVTPVQTMVPAGACSTATIEARDANGSAAPVAANTVLSLVSQPGAGAGFRFYSDSGCTTSTSTMTMAAGTSRATFYFRGTLARSYRLTVSATGLGSVQQTESIVAGAPASLVFISDPQTVQAGVCSSRVDLELRDAYGNATPMPTQTSATLLAQEGSGIVFFFDSDCDTATSEAVFPAGSARTSFYFGSKTGGTFNVSTTTGLLTATQRETILPVVRTGSCPLEEGEGWVTCSISPPQVDMSKTLLMFQASSDDDSPDSASLNCSLTSESTITCSRNDFDDGDEPEILIRWQTAELATGLNVQHLQAECSGEPETELPIEPVSSLLNTFLLVSSEQNGSTQGDDDYYTASMSAVDHVDLNFSSDCQLSWTASVQVVEYQGTDVTRGLTGSMNGTSLVVSNLPPVDLGSTALLFTYRTTGADNTSVMCDRILRGELTSPTSITFTRGSGATGCAAATINSISWERIQFNERARAQHFNVTMGSSTTTVNVPVTSVDTTRTLVFASGQIQSGQGSGETSYSGDDIIGAALGWHTLTSPTNLRVTRGAALGTARFYSTALQLEP
ncbi:hypothetical protein [Hyalangium minutum]|uniref:Lipoprotein n=1 Tax=Hyalangium minutum TaxID=394096 RepID=A0A085VXI9_9BACT|nr:hypothetical protein [Hyalangium minutum]KFE60152.1 hypothetical protein DB31_6023 [Hyalangium minutum]